MPPQQSSQPTWLRDIWRGTAGVWRTEAAEDSLQARSRLLLIALCIPALLIQAVLAAGLGSPGGILLLAAGLVAVALVLTLRGAVKAGGLLAMAALLGGPLLLVLTGPALSAMLTTAFVGMGALAALLIALTLLSFRSVVFLAGIVVLVLAVLNLTAGRSGADAGLDVTISILHTLGAALIFGALLIIRAADQALRTSEERYRRISSLAGDLCFLVRMGPGEVYRVGWLSAPGAFSNLTDPAGRGEMGLEAIIHPDDLPGLRDTFTAAREGKPAARQLRVRAEQGGFRWALLSVYRVAEAQAGRATELYGLIEDIHDEARAEQALREERARYENLVNSIDGVVYEINAETRETLFISRQVEQLLGFTVDDFVKNRMLWIERIHPDDVERAVSFSKVKIAEYESYEQQYRMVAANGALVWVRELAAVKAEPCQPVMLHGLALNETASREAQRAEQEQRRLREALHETTATVSATLNLTEVADRIFAALQQTTPADAADIMLIDNGIARVFRARDFKGNADMEWMLKVELPVATTPNLCGMAMTGSPHIVEDVATNKDWVAFAEAAWIASTVGVPIQLEDQTIGFLNLTSNHAHAFTPDHAEFLQTFADQIAIAVRNARLYEEARRSAVRLAEQVKERTAELELERERLSVMLDSTAEGIYYTEGSTIRYVNPAFCAMLGYQAEELVGQPFGMLMALTEEERLQRHAAIADTLKTERVWRGEQRYTRKDGTLLDCGVTISSMTTRDSREPGLVVLVRDISREKALQAQQSNLVAYASHELRTPITNLKTRLYLLRRRPELLDEHVEILEEVTDRMRRLVEDLLDLTRMERGISRLDRHVTDVVALAHSIYRLQLPEADRKGLHFTCELPDLPLYADVDAERMTQVITNLITNALNYTPDGGAVRLRVAPAPEDHQVQVQVSDSGIGIGPDALPYIFQPFYRVVSAVEGAGLGLSIAREIVELHGGQIGVQSKTGEGSTFTVRLPLVEAPVPAAGD